MNNKYWSDRIINQEPYTPGEYPVGRKVIKLNTNENPYPPSQKAVEAAKVAVSGDLRLYPDPECTGLKDAIAEANGLAPENVFVGNGSDEILAFCFLAFFDAGKPIISADVTYSFYPVYASLFGVEYIEEPLNPDWTMPVDAFCRNKAPILLTNPNAPTGIALTLDEVERIVRSNPDHLVLVDEAYVAFGAQSAVPLIEKYPNLLVCRTFSKSHSLAGSRVGYAMGDEGLIAALECVKHSFNSYTLDRAALAAAQAAILDTEHFERTRSMIIDTRERITSVLEGIGFRVLPSSANFIFISNKSVSSSWLYDRLSWSGILVRHWNKPRVANYLRVSIGTDAEMDAFVDLLKAIIWEADLDVLRG